VAIAKMRYTADGRAHLDSQQSGDYGKQLLR